MRAGYELSRIAVAQPDAEIEILKAAKLAKKSGQRIDSAIDEMRLNFGPLSEAWVYMIYEGGGTATYTPAAIRHQMIDNTVGAWMYMNHAGANGVGVLAFDGWRTQLSELMASAHIDAPHMGTCKEDGDIVIYPICASNHIAELDAPKIHDPACGAGLLLADAITKLSFYFGQGKHSEASFNAALACVSGADIDEGAVLACRSMLINLGKHLAGANSSINTPNVWVYQNRDLGFLDPQYTLHAQDIIVMNPPYLGSGKLPVEMREFLRKHYPSSYQNLFTAFMARAIQCINEGGLMACVVPAVWTFLTSFERHRKHMAEAANYKASCNWGEKAFPTITGFSLIAHSSFWIKRESNHIPPSLFT